MLKEKCLLLNTVIPIGAMVIWELDVWACTMCHTETGQQVRTGISVDFLTNFLVTLAPFPVLAVIVALIYFGPLSFLHFRSNETSKSKMEISEGFSFQQWKRK
jgi:hypothetical protein